MTRSSILLEDLRKTLNSLVDGHLNHLKNLYPLGRKLGIEKSALDEYRDFTIVLSKIEICEYKPDQPITYQVINV